MTKTKRQKDTARLRKQRLEAAALTAKLERKATTTPKPSKHCGCLNRNGGNKVMHHSEQAATDWMIAHLRKRSGFTLYQCPKRPEIYHVATKRRR